MNTDTRPNLFKDSPPFEDDYVLFTVRLLIGEQKWQCSLEHFSTLAGRKVSYLEDVLARKRHLAPSPRQSILNAIEKRLEELQESELDGEHSILELVIDGLVGLSEYT